MSHTLSIGGCANPRPSAGCSGTRRCGRRWNEVGFPSRGPSPCSDELRKGWGQRASGVSCPSSPNGRPQEAVSAIGEGQDRPDAGAEDGTHVAQAVPRNGCNVSCGASGERKPRDGGPAHSPKGLRATGGRPERQMPLLCLSPRLCTLVLGFVGIGALDRLRHQDVVHVQVTRRCHPEDCAEKQGCCAAARYFRERRTEDQPDQDHRTRFPDPEAHVP